MAYRWIYLIFRKLRRGRILFLFVFFVLLPTIPLAYLASRTIGGDPEKTAGEINDYLNRVGSDLRRELTEAVLDCETELDRIPEKERTWDRLIEVAADEKVSCPFFKDFFILDSGFRLRFPFSPRGREVTDVLEVVRSEEPPTEFSRNLAAGDREEFVAGNLQEACLAYRKARQAADDELSVPLALQALARCSFKQKDYREAAGYYRQILDSGDTGVFLGGLSLDLIARFRLGELEELKNKPREAFRRYLSIIRQLSRGLLAGSVYEASFYASRVRERVKEFRAAGILDAGELSDFERALSAWEERKASALRMERLREASRPELQALMEETGGSLEKKIIKIMNGEESVLLCRTLPDPESGAPLILAAVLDPVQLGDEVRTAIKVILDSGEDVNLTVYDARGEVVARGGDPATDSRYRASVSLEPLLPSFELHLAYRKQGLLLELARREKMADLGYMLFLLLIIFLGLYVTYRLIKKDSELSRLKSDFVSRVSHELRTPLATIRAVGEMLEMGAVSGREKEREYFSFIASESERLSRLIDNVLDFSRIEARKKRYVFRPARIQKAVSSTIRAFREYSRAEGFEIIYHGDEEIPPVSIDEDAISQALINLLDNAVKFSRDNKVVEVNLSQAAGKVLLSVKDRGIGIARENFERIFDDFYRLKEARELTSEGAGLGLAIVRHIARAHGGRVEVRSSPGEGSTFTLVLPIL